MGLYNSYEMLGGGRAAAAPLASKQQRVLDFFRKWLLCCGWKEEEQQGKQQADHHQHLHHQQQQQQQQHAMYVRPAGWKRLLRRVRAKTRKVRATGGLCFAAPEQPLNYGTIDSYKKNFDDGRESSWEYVYSCELIREQSRRASSASASAPILWQQQPQQQVMNPIRVLHAAA